VRTFIWNSARADVRYGDFRGMKLDRRMHELQQSSQAGKQTTHPAAVEVAGEMLQTPEGRVAALAVLTPAERNGFLPEPLWSELEALTSRLQVVDGSAMSTEDLHRELAAFGPEVLITCWKTPPLPAELPGQLRYVCHLAGSVKHIVSRAHLDRGLLVTNWGSSISRVVAEGALLHILACLRRASAWSIAMHKNGAWKDEQTETSSLFGRRVGLHGFGRIARELVKLMRPFDVSIEVCAPDVTPAIEREWGVRCAASLEALFSESEVIVELAPLVAETRGSVQERHLRLIHPGGVFVNVGRGDLVDEDALVRVAREGRVQFGLDVFAREPLPVDHPLRGLMNVSLTPHIAGPTSERRRDAGAWALANLQAYVAGVPLTALITTQNYDSST
jgi:phosphoglycerate dehydrogenase-like enzyme